MLGGGRESSVGWTRRTLKCAVFVGLYLLQGLPCLVCAICIGVRSCWLLCLTRLTHTHVYMHTLGSTHRHTYTNSKHFCWCELGGNCQIVRFARVCQGPPLLGIVALRLQLRPPRMQGDLFDGVSSYHISHLMCHSPQVLCQYATAFCKLLKKEIVCEKLHKQLWMKFMIS